MRNPAGPYGGHPFDWDPTLRKAIFDAAAKKVKKLPGSPQPSKLDTGRAYKPTYNPPPRRGTANESHDFHIRAINSNRTQPKGKTKHYIVTKVNNKELRDNLTPGDVLHNSMFKSGKDGLKYSGGYSAKLVGIARAGKEALKEDAHDLEGKSSRVAKTKKATKHKKLHEVSKALAKRYVTAASKDIANSESEAMKHGNSEYGNKMYSKAQKRFDGITKAIKKKVTEARSEWTANQHLAATAGKPAKGHYLMRDGRRLSGPHSPEDAVKQYKGMSDSKGVKIVHVKEALSKGHEWYRTKNDVHYKKDGSVYTPTGKARGAAVLPKGRAGYFKGDKFVAIGQEWHGIEKHHVTKVDETVEMFDVTHMILEESKVKKAAQRAIKLAKDAKKGKVDLKPTLDVADRGSGGPLNGSLDSPEGQK